MLSWVEHEKSFLTSGQVVLSELVPVIKRNSFLIEEEPQ